jgi:transposase
MQKTERQCIGIDCAKDDFAVSLCSIDDQREIKTVAGKTFKNSLAGFKGFDLWASKLINPGIPVLFVMEATGVYHENLACYLYDKGRQVSIVLPKRAKDFSKTLKVKTINDQVAARYLSAMGLEKKLDLWRRPSTEYIHLRHLTREKQGLQEQLTAVKNEIHAMESGAWVYKPTLTRLKQQVRMLESQIKQVINDISEMIKKNAQMKELVDLATTIPGVGILTAATVIAETKGFEQMQNRRQLISYAGLDVQYHQSGTSISTKPRISKKGNRHIRRAMHMPALCSIRLVDMNKSLFARVVSRTGIRMKGVVAVQRKLLVLIYAVCKNKTPYDANYEKGKVAEATLHELDQVRSMN